MYEKWQGLFHSHEKGTDFPLETIYSFLRERFYLLYPLFNFIFETQTSYKIF